MYTDVRDVCLSGLSVMRLKLAAARAEYAVCRVRGVIQCSLRQGPLASCCYLFSCEGKSGYGSFYLWINM